MKAGTTATRARRVPSPMQGAITVAVLLSVLSACNAAEMVLRSSAGIEAGAPIPLSPGQVIAVEEGVRRALKDPESASFGAMAAGRSAVGQVTVCGFVDAKNSYGGYTGEKPFIGRLTEDVFSVDLIGSEREDSAGILSVCRKAGAST